MLLEMGKGGGGGGGGASRAALLRRLATASGGKFDATERRKLPLEKRRQGRFGREVIEGS